MPPCEQEPWTLAHVPWLLYPKLLRSLRVQFCRHVQETLLPASTQCLVELHQALVLIASGLGESNLCQKQRSLPIEHLEVGGDASPIPHQGRVNRILQILDSYFLRDADLVKFLVTDQGIGNIAERQLDDLLIRNQFLAMLRLSQFQIPAQRSTRENGLRDLGAIGPDSSL